MFVEYPESNGKKRQPNKLMTQNAGPFRVTDYDMKGEYQLFNLVNNEIRKNVSVHRLKSYNHDITIDISPDQVAMKDKQYFEVEKILDYKGNEKKVSTLKFLTKWKGYDDSENTWQDWKDIRSNIKLHEYLISKKLGYLIPKSYQHLYNPRDVTRSAIKPGKVRNFTFVEQKKNNNETVWVKKLLS